MDKAVFSVKGEGGFSFVLVYSACLIGLIHASLKFIELLTTLLFGKSLFLRKTFHKTSVRMKLIPKTELELKVIFTASMCGIGG